MARSIKSDKMATWTDAPPIPSQKNTEARLLSTGSAKSDQQKNMNGLYLRMVWNDAEGFFPSNILKKNSKNYFEQRTLLFSFRYH